METLFDLMPLEDVDEKLSLEERFELFHARNPQVYETLRDLALDLVDRGKTKIGIAMIYEVLRWQHAMRTKDDNGYKLNNDFRSRYARLIMDNEPRLAGVFETRRIHD